MTFGVSSLLLGFLIFPVTDTYPAGSCNGYTNVTEPWRNKDFPTASYLYYPVDDWYIQMKWLRFTGIGGDRIYTDCVPTYRGGSVGTLYISQAYPTADSATATTLDAYGNYFSCQYLHTRVNVVFCPGGFYIYQPLNHPSLVYAGYVTYHYQCTADSCGPNAMCSAGGGCVCVPGMGIPSGNVPTADAYGCADINECKSLGTCGSYSICTNTIGSYTCACESGFNATDPALPANSSNPCLDIDECLVVVCVNAVCANSLGSFACVCNQGYQPVLGSATDCQDIDECQDTTYCGSYAACVNSMGSFSCTCLDGFSPLFSTFPPKWSNPCTDINECLQINCGGGTCSNNPGSYVCQCSQGYQLDPAATPPCIDVDECLVTPDICGPDSVCTNTDGSYVCTCVSGFSATSSLSAASASNPCIDINECQPSLGICGPNSNCTNTPGSYTCICLVGFIAPDPTLPPAKSNPCEDIDECLQSMCGSGTCYNGLGSFLCDCYGGYVAVADATPVCQDIDECTQSPGICGKNALCNNKPGTFYCSCPDQFHPTTGVAWVLGKTYCESLDDTINNIKPQKGKNKQRIFLEMLAEEVQNNTSVILPEATVANMLSSCMIAGGINPQSGVANVSSAGDGDTGSLILSIADHLAAEMVSLPYSSTHIRVQSSTVDLNLVTIGNLSEADYDQTIILRSRNNSMQVNLYATAVANKGSAGASFMVLDGMESLLSHQYFQSENQTEMFSDVVSGLLLPITNAHVSKPINFTLQHKDSENVPQYGMVTCVFWDSHGETNTMKWSTEGCWVSSSGDNYTVCTCSHLSTFALIMQIGEPPPSNPFVDWLNRACVIIGLFFLALAILTFLLCSWNPKINNTARLHLCINLALSQLLMLWNDKYLDNKLACKVMAGLLHFLVVASFVWMLLEALQLHLLVRKLSKVQVIQRDGLPRPLLYLIGYGVPFVIVGVSALVFSDGYGATAAQACWLSTERHFNWALTGPVIGILALNWTLFCATLWSLKPTLANMKSDVSQSKDTRLIIFKILAQFVILGCTWILGLYQTNLFFEVLFIILNSQQGTFLYIVHCVLNKEVRDEYIKWLTCSFGKDNSAKDALSLSEDFSKAEEKADGGRRD